MGDQLLSFGADLHQAECSFVEFPGSFQVPDRDMAAAPRVRIVVASPEESFS
jgi:hypothetical protein